MSAAAALELRSAVEADLPAIIAIAAASPEAPRWSPSQYSSILKDGSRDLVREVVVCTIAGEIAGFGVLSVLLSVVPAEAEIENLAVSGRLRRQGFGRALLRELFRRAGTHKAESVQLEVRSANTAALALYFQAGFTEIGRRSGYYRNPADDAVLLGTTIPVLP